MRTLLLAVVLFGLPALAESYSYDEAGRVTKVTYDDGTSITYRYDAAGNLIEQAAVGNPAPAPTPQPKPCGCAAAPLSSAAGWAAAVMMLRRRRARYD